MSAPDREAVRANIREALIDAWLAKQFDILVDKATDLFVVLSGDTASEPVIDEFHNGLYTNCLACQSVRRRGEYGALSGDTEPAK